MIRRIVESGMNGCVYSQDGNRRFEWKGLRIESENYRRIALSIFDGGKWNDTFVLLHHGRNDNHIFLKVRGADGLVTVHLASDYSDVVEEEEREVSKELKKSLYRFDEINGRRINFIGTVANFLGQLSDIGEAKFYQKPVLAERKLKIRKK